METIDMEKITLEQLRAERADIVESIAKSAVESYLQGEEAKAKDAQLKALTEQVDEFKTREALAAKKAKIDGLLEEAKLPKEAITETFRKSLEDAKDEAAVKELIEDRKALVGSVRPNGQPPRSREQGAGGSGGPLSVPDTKSFVESIAG
jgi:restriction endonuclease Mrr